MSINNDVIGKTSLSLSDLAANKYAPEKSVIEKLLRDNSLSPAELKGIETQAVAIVNSFRAQPEKQTILDAFLQEYGLSNKEGVALMCLAEALLRVPDKATRDDLIADKIAPGDWASHIGGAGSFLVNASTWGLLLTGRVVSMAGIWEGPPSGAVGRLVNRLGEPAIRKSVGQAMKILGGEFVLGETIDGAIKRGGKLFPSTQIYSFDMLGEGARTDKHAERHYQSYVNAINRTGQMDEGGSVFERSVFERSGVSVKLSAIYPRYEFENRADALEVIGGKLLELAKLAASHNVKLTVDAEEADRLELSLEIFEYVARAMDISKWSGFGLAIQAYGRRARHVIAWVADLAEELGARFMVRLVKGAYWDAEIKHAQELGLPDFTVFTRKSSTDLSYLVCAQDMYKRRDVLFCQFATHNAHTIAAIMKIWETALGAYEFQRLHGMGEAVYEVSREHYSEFPPVRIYAPVGGHEDLLAYLVRRLLENGANSSFINRFMDAEVPASDVVPDPVGVTRNLQAIAHPKISKPENIFGMSRINSKGLDLTSSLPVSKLNSAIDAVYAETFSVHSLIYGKRTQSGQSHPVVNPSLNSDSLGRAETLDVSDLAPSFEAARKAQPAWNALGGAARADILNRAADLMEMQSLRLMGILTREAGKTSDDSIAEVREAVDFCRYYADRAAAEFTHPETLPGVNGEENSIMLGGRGVFAVISPWNFPLAIFIGQTVAALAAGNSVLTKPAPQTPIIAFEAVKILYEAGVPSDVLMLVLGGGALGAALVEHEAVAGVAFTGSTGTAKKIHRSLANKDGAIVPLIAETGGQNVMFVDSTALLEQVTDDVIQSSFKSAGQRCSSLRVLYLQDEIADKAIEMIQGAMDTLIIGDPRHLKTDIGPIIDEGAAASLGAHIKNLTDAGKPSHKTPIREALKDGNYIMPHIFEIGNISELDQEHFGPILHVIRYKASDLEDTLKSAFSTGYGLTLGIHTRMDSRWSEIFKKAPVGNTYVNRNTTGAVVGSQPFGGQGLSGTGFKAGGPRYLYKFASEKTLSVNTMASGGDTELLTLD